jgi:hypothetical protein
MPRQYPTVFRDEIVRRMLYGETYFNHIFILYRSIL